MTTACSSAFIAGLALAALGGCKAQPPSAEKIPAPAHEAPKPGPAAPANHFGAAIRPGHEASLAKVLANPREYQGKTVTVQGEVRRVCKKMGCWMELATEMNDKAPGCRVFFGAHQFFVPKDSDGASARVQGEVRVQKVQASFVEHLEGEGASFKQKNSDGTADEVRLVASGVELTPS